MKYKLTILIMLMTLITLQAYALNVPILLYHNTYAPFNESQAAINIAPDTFEEHLKGLSGAGYNVISLDEYVEYANGQFNLPENPLIITFDDGYTSNYLYAYPILKKYNMKATIFVVTSRMGDNDTVFPHFSWEQARDMENSGFIDIYSHTDSHLQLTDLTDEQLTLELRRSKFMIEKELNKKCGIIAYPFGMFNDKVSQFALNAGYSVTCKVGDIGSNFASDGLLGLKRLTVHGDMTAGQVIEMIQNN